MQSASLPQRSNAPVLSRISDWMETVGRRLRELLFPGAPFRTVFEEATEGIMVHEPDTGEMVAVNQQACEMFGYEQDEVEHLAVEDLIAGKPPYDSDRAAQITDEVLHEGPQTVEWKYQRDNGTSFWGEVKLKTIQFRGDCRVLALINDITDRKRYEQALRKAEASARKANQFKSAILTNVTHAVRTPLTAILGYADLLENKVEGDAHRFAVQIEKSGQRLKKTYDALLELAHLDAHTRELTPERVDVVAVVGKIAQTYQSRAAAEEVTLSFEPPGSPCTGPFDRTGLVRIVEELLENALAFTGPGDTIRVVVEAASGHVQIRVADTGPGIPETFRSRMFEAFTRASEADTAGVRGAGIGLTIVKGLVDLMDGTIDVESEEGSGTRITVRLPKT
jgi:PAS domain S-box-containing protein